MDIAAWLRELGLERYEQTFQDNEVDARSLPHLRAEDLKEMGVTAIGHRRLLLQAIAALQESGAPAGEPVSTRINSSQGVSDTAGRGSEAERRQLTVLFCDLVGSTELATRLDPEDLRRVIGLYQDTAARAIGHYEGHVAKFLGDGVLAYFGYPAAHEDAAERAVRAGLELVAAIGGLEVPLDVSLHARVGIATGLVVVGHLIGEAAADRDAVLGETPNLAARLQAVAEPDMVVIAPDTRRLLGGLFDIADLGEHEVKGFARPVRVWHITGESAAQSRFEALRGHHLTPLVGRQNELGILLERWAWARQGDGQVVLLSGEAGIGKSRIVQALREQLPAEPHTLLDHYGSPYHGNSALHPIFIRLMGFPGLGREEPPEHRLAALEALAAQSTDRVDQAVPLFAALLSIPTAEATRRSSSAPSARSSRRSRHWSIN